MCVCMYVSRREEKKSRIINLRKRKVRETPAEKLYCIQMMSLRYRIVRIVEFPGSSGKGELKM